MEEDELPKPSRYYKSQAFELSLPEVKPDHVYIKSNPPYNSSVMLVPKKKPGQYRLVVDNRLVNAECELVGAISAAPFGVIKNTRGAKYFTTLDCRNAFYSLKLRKEDKEYTLISPPGMPKLELTRIPMGTKTSTAALYQAREKYTRRDLYRYVLVWADDIIISGSSMEEHIQHVVGV